MVTVEPGRSLHGRYRLVAPIARGGMAEVWEGVDDVLTRPIAVKLLHPQLAADEAFQERFRREAIAAARLAHANVVATFDTGEDEGTAFIVMELVRGRTLRQMLADEGGALPAWLVRDLGVQVAEALQSAHEAGLVHRDVKPANILVCDGDPGAPLQVKVADFGIARAATHDGADLTQPGALLGTAKYLAPEQVEGRPPDARTDIYALGVVLYECLTGRPPFAADTEVATAMAHVHQEPRKPRQLRAGIPRAIEAVVTRAMAKDPAARYQSAADLAAALRAVDLGDDAVPSVVRDPTPPSGMAPTFRQTERTWLVPAAVIVGIAVVLVVLAIVLSQSDVGPKILGRTTDESAKKAVAPLVLTGAHSFDPRGQDRTENEASIGLVLDADPASTWRTDRYNTREFGGLKDGVGVIVQLQGSHDVKKVRVASPTKGWSGRIYVAGDGGAPELSGWGDPVAQDDDIDGDTTFDLGDGKRGGAVLVWVTRLGDDGRVAIGEITVEG
jgi:serine/threonine-protein kinase